MAILDLQAAVRNVIGTDVQAWDAQLDDIAALDVTQNDNFLVSDGANWTQETPTQVRTTLGLIAGGAGDIWVEKAGDTMTGTLTLSPGAGTGTTRCGSWPRCSPAVESSAWTSSSWRRSTGSTPQISSPHGWSIGRSDTGSTTGAGEVE